MRKHRLITGKIRGCKSNISLSKMKIKYVKNTFIHIFSKLLLTTTSSLLTLYLKKVENISL